MLIDCMSMASFDVGAGGGVGSGVGSGAGAGGGAAGCGLRSTSTPFTGPMHVVPVKGSRSVLPLSSIAPLPVSVNAQLGSPGPVPVPVTVIATFVPLSCPVALPLIEMPPPQSPVNVPAIDDAVCVAI